MTTLIMTDADYSPAGIKRRLKEEFARQGIESETEAAERYGRPQQWLSRRITGETEWKFGELEEFCRALGLSFTYVATGIRELPTPPRPPAHPFPGGSQGGGATIHHMRPVAAAGGAERVDDRQLTHVQRDTADEAVDDDAIAYLQLADPANNSAKNDECPHQDSNLGPAD